MNSTVPAEHTIGDQMPWYGMTMDDTERICELIPDELWHWRPADPQGHFQASLGEIAMHCADERHGFAQALSGEVDSSVYFTLSPGQDGINTFRDGVRKQEVMASLRTGRALLDRYANLPASRLTEVMEGSRAAYDRQIAAVKQQGKDTTSMELRGAPGIFRVLMAAACHEAGHRGTLYTLLRMNGVRLPTEG